jgi:hypothetical protein
VQRTGGGGQGGEYNEQEISDTKRLFYSKLYFRHRKRGKVRKRKKNAAHFRALGGSREVKTN